MNNTVTFIYYISVYFLALLFLRTGINKKKTNQKYMFYIDISFLLLLFVIVFRASTVGMDYISVGNQYSILSKYGFNALTNRQYDWFGLPLELLCIIIGKIFGSSPFVFYFILGTLTMLFLYKFLLSSCKYPTLTLFLYFMTCLYLQTFNQSRQMLALVIILYSLKFIKEADLKKYSFTILLASIFHSSALIFLPLYFLKNVKFSYKLIIIYIILGFILFFGNNFLYQLISSTKYGIYFSTKYNVSFLSSSIINLIVRVILLLFCVLFRTKNNKSKTENYCLHMITICTILQVLTLKYYFFGRLTTYFFAFYLVLLPICLDNFLKHFNNPKKTVLYILFCLSFMVYFYVYYHSATGAIGGGYNEYNFIFTEK